MSSSTAKLSVEALWLLVTIGHCVSAARNPPGRWKIAACLFEKELVVEVEKESWLIEARKQREKYLRRRVVKNRNKKNSINRRSNANSKVGGETSLSPKGIPSGKLNIKIFSASKHTPTYSPHSLASISYSGTYDPRVGLDIQTEERQPLPQVNELESWQEVVASANLSVRATNVLLKNFSSYEKLLASDEKSLRNLRNCGRKTVKELVEFRNTIAQKESDQPGAKVPIRPKSAEEVFCLPPVEENIYLLPVFSSKPVVDFAVHDLHPGFYGAAPLKDFVLSIRASKILKKLGLKTIGEVMLFPAGELLTQKNFGRKCLREVQDIIRSFILAGGILQPAASVNIGSEKLSEIDFSSYANLVASFARNCLKNKRNQAIVCSRLDFHGAKPTLEQLGEQFGLTRERVRQILKRGNALLRAKAHRMLLQDLWELISETIRQGGGLISLHDLSQSLQNNYHWPDLPGPAALAELLSVVEEEKIFSVSENLVSAPCPCLSCETPREFLPSLDFEAHESYHLLVVGERLMRHCQNRCNTASQLQRFHKAFTAKIADDSSGAYRLHGELIFPHDCWLIRHGERLEDLIVHVLEKHGKPMHFSEIASAIRKENIKHREISDHNVHAAMMRYDSIEIIQRGTYGLKAWGAGGYRSVSTAIEELLATYDLPMRRSDIIKQLTGEFSEQNISAALHNWSSRFESIGEGFYERPERWRKRSVAEFIQMLPPPIAELARFVTTNNNCSYKLVLALVFIRGMDEKGAYYLPTLKERFYNYYLGRLKKGEVVEAENVLIRRIGEIEANEIRNKAIRRPLESFLSCNLWNQKYSSLYLQKSLVALLSNPEVHNLLLITFLKGIADYFSVFSSPPTSSPMGGAKMDVRICEPNDVAFVEAEERSLDGPGDSTLTISIKRKGRSKIAL